MTKETLSSSRDLKAWQLGMEVTRMVYEITRKFPSSEQFGLTSQTRRAAASVPANIAEGHARDSTREFVHHLSIALGSLAEVETFLQLAMDLRYCEPNAAEDLSLCCDELGRVLRGLQKAVKARL